MAGNKHKLFIIGIYLVLYIYQAPTVRSSSSAPQERYCVFAPRVVFVTVAVQHENAQVFCGRCIFEALGSAHPKSIRGRKALSERPAQATFNVTAPLP